MAINTIQGFNPSTTEPIDSRVIVADETARLAFATFNVYEGLVVYQEDTDELYVLNDPANPDQTSSWSTVGEGAGFPFTGSAEITGSLDVIGSANISDGLTITGSINQTGDLTVDGIITAKEFHTEFVSASIIYQSGSTKFGDTSDDVHQFTGSIQQSGSDSYFLGKVGIGTSSPTLGGSAGIDIYNQSYPQLRLHNASTGTNISSGFLIGLTTTDVQLKNYENSPITISTNDSPRMTILGGGNVGIGTTSPSSKLHVSGANATNLVHFHSPRAEYKFYSDSMSTYTTLFNMDDTGLDIGHNSSVRAINLKTNNTDRLTILGGGNIGIGTTSPTEKLHIVGNQKIDGSEFYITTGASTRKPVKIYNNAFKGAITLQRDGVDNVNISSDFSFNGHTYFNGQGTNVGIGTTSPSAKLHVFSDTHSDFLDNGILLDVSSSDEGEPAVAFRNQSDMGSNYWIAGVNEGGGNFDFAYGTLFTSANTKIRFTSDGKVGIGTTSPTQTLDVNGSVIIRPDNTTDTISFLNLGSAQSRLVTTNNFAIWSGGSEVMRLLSNGNVGIGTSNPTDLLHILKNQDAPTQIRVANQSNTGNARASITIGDAGNAITMARYLSNYTTVSSWASSGGILTDSGLTNGFFFRTSAGPIRFQPAGNTDRVVFDTSGNVGIGTTTPTTSLHVVGNGITNQAPGNAVINIDRGDNPAYSSMLVWRTGNSPKWYAGLTDTGDNPNYTGYDFMIGQTKGSPSIFIDTSDNVGIGTTSPTAKLDVSGSGNFTDDLDVSGSLHVLGDLTVGKISNQSKLLDVGGNFNFDTVGEPSSIERAAFSASIVSSPGNIDNGTHYYHVIYKTADGGETGAYGTPFLEAIITDNTVAGQVQLTGIPTSSDARVTSRDIYRTQANQSQYYGKKLATLSDNTTTTYLDNLADSSLDLNTQFYRKANSTAGYFYKDNNLFAQAGNIHYTSFGVDALESVTIGQDNVAFGGSALQLTTTGKENTAVGYSAGVNNTTGNDNTYLGYVAGYYNTTGNYNTQIGSFAGRLASQTVASSNTHVGYYSGNSLTTNNNNNVGLGFRAGGGFQGSNNINIGYGAGYNNPATTRGDNNITIGFNAGQDTTGDGNILLGKDIEAPNAASNGQLSIGNLIFGTDLSYSGNAMSTGNVGIGTTTPSYRLDVSGSGRFTDGLTVTGSLAATSQINLGYPSTLGMKLSIADSGITPQGIHIRTGQPTIELQDWNTGGKAVITSDDGSITFQADVSNTKASSNIAFEVDTIQRFKIDENGLTVTGSLTQTASTASFGGVVGIGTTSPSSKLHVSGSSDVFLVEGSGSSSSTTLMAVDGTNGRLFEVSDDLSDSLFSVNTIAGLPVLEVFADNTVKMGAFNQNDLVVTGSNVGIGTDIPSAKLHVSGTVQIDDILTISPQDPLPSGVPIGSFAVSSSAPPKPYFYDGTNWNALY